MTPNIEQLTERIHFEDPKDPAKDAETHDVPFGHLPVVAFADEALRDVVARFWDCRAFRKDKLEPEVGEVITRESIRAHYTELRRLLGRFAPSGISAGFARTVQVPFVRVHVVLSYPLHSNWRIEETIPANEIGRVFAIAHDLYREIYRLDDAAHGVSIDKPAPRAAPQLLNRARGKYVWGHDMRDLVFEGMAFLPNPEMQPLERDKTYSEPPLLGTFGFFIGS